MAEYFAFNLTAPDGAEVPVYWNTKDRDHDGHWFLSKCHYHLTLDEGEAGAGEVGQGFDVRKLAAYLDIKMKNTSDEEIQRIFQLALDIGLLKAENIFEKDLF